MKKIIFLIIIITFLIIFSFLYPKNKNTEKNNKLEKVKVAEVTHSIFYTPLYVAHSLGYFKENGLDVEIILTSGADKVASAVMSKDVQIGFCGSEQTVYIYNRGAKDYLVNFAGMTKKDGSFLVSRDNKKFDINDLNNKVILGGRNGGMPAMTLNYTLYKKGIKANVDTSVDFASLSGAFIGGNGDYVTLFEPTALSLEKEGYGYVVESIGNLGGEVPYTSFNALKSYIDKNPEVIKGFSKAINKGIEYTKNTDNKELAKILIDYFPDSSLEDIEKVVKRYKDIDSWYDNTYITENSWNNMIDIVKYNGFLEKEVKYNTLVNNDYNE